MAFSDRYFASANSKNGFVGFFDEVFGECDYRYILKGGPGTGKSSLMRRLGQKAEEAGHTTEYILCSSDPDSLDGVIITDLGIAMMDGTAPHVCDVSTPGIDSELINLGVYWRKNKLAAYADEIKEKSSEKSELYTKAYHTISATALMEGMIHAISKKAFYAEKAAAYAARVAASFKNKTIASPRVRLMEGYGMSGRCELDAFKTETNYRLLPSYLLEYDLLDLIYRALSAKHIPMYVSYRAIDAKTVNGIYLPEEKVSFTIGAADAGEKPVNTERFFDKSILRESKNKLRFARKCIKELEAQRDDIFARIKACHFEIEEYYKKAMNFTKLTKDTDKLIEKILS